MSNFGALTDQFSIATADMEVVASSKVPRADSRGNALDENGDITASTYYGAGSLFDISTTYALKSGTLSLATLKLGEISAGVFAATLEAATSNTDWPQITVTGVSGIETINDTYATFTLPTITLAGKKQAQLMGFTVTSGCKLNASTLSAAVELAQLDDGVGEPAAHGVSGGTWQVSADFVRVTVAPGWTVTDTGLTETQVPGVDEPQAAYHTGTGVAEGTLTRDVA